MAVGAAGVGVAAATVEMFAGLDARFVDVNVNGPPNEPVVVFCKENVAGLGALVNVQTIFAKVFRLTIGTVMVLPARLPKLAGLPLVPAFVSVQPKPDTVKLVLAASVKVTGEALLAMVLETGVVGAAVAAAVVVILEGVPCRFVAVKVKGPPANPVVIFWIATDGIAGFTVLVMVQVICAFNFTFAAGIVTNVPANAPKLPGGLPEFTALASVQLAAVNVKLVTAGSFIVTADPTVVTRTGAGTAG